MTETATKAKAKTTKAASADTETKSRKGEPRPSAIVGDIDFDGVEEDRLNVPVQRRSRWDDVLDKVYNATEDGRIGRDEDGKLRFVKIGGYATGQSAKAQVKAFHERKLDATYEFKVSGKDLFVRVREAD